MSRDLLCSCHRLRRAGRAVTRLYEQALGDSGVTPQQFAVLSALMQSAAGTTASDLASELGIERSALTRTLDRMHAQGWLEVRAHPGDRRRHPMAVTAEGQLRFEQGVRGWRRAEATLRHTMGPERVALLWDLLEEAEHATQAFDPLRGKSV